MGLGEDAAVTATLKDYLGVEGNGMIGGKTCCLYVLCF